MLVTKWLTLSLMTNVLSLTSVDDIRLTNMDDELFHYKWYSWLRYDFLLTISGYLWQIADLDDTLRMLMPIRLSKSSNPLPKSPTCHRHFAHINLSAMNWGSSLGKIDNSEGFILENLQIVYYKVGKISYYFELFNYIRNLPNLKRDRSDWTLFETNFKLTILS